MVAKMPCAVVSEGRMVAVSQMVGNEDFTAVRGA